MGLKVKPRWEVIPTTMTATDSSTGNWTVTTTSTDWPTTSASTPYNATIGTIVSPQIEALQKRTDSLEKRMEILEENQVDLDDKIKELEEMVNDFRNLLITTGLMSRLNALEIIVSGSSGLEDSIKDIKNECCELREDIKNLEIHVYAVDDDDPKVDPGSDG